MLNCSLCGSSTLPFCEAHSRNYWRCNNCALVMLAPEHFLSPQAEKQRYLEHNNDPEDPRYQQFVSPIVHKVKANFTVEHKGLDFGAGTGPVITELLTDSGYRVELYDPFFHNYPTKLTRKYDYVICCEVIEHFQQPAVEFTRLRDMLNPGGAILCMTELYADDTDFASWYYIKDPTHVIFYHRRSLAWIKWAFNFSQLAINRRLIELWA